MFKKEPVPIPSNKDALANLRVKDRQAAADAANWAAQKFVWIPDEREGIEDVSIGGGEGGKNEE